MEAPNAPNPENPNAQGDPDQNQDQVPAGPAPAPGPTQPVPQPVPAQPAPAGVIPQIFYQHWIGKKTEFSGKPEEDVESFFLAQEIGWKCIISQKERMYDILD